MKVQIRRLDSLTHNDTAATKLINDNFEALQQGVEDAISRSGKKPNFMDDVLDMNMHRIINIADPVDNNDLANKSYVGTKVSEEEGRAKAAEEEEKNVRIASDNALEQLINNEKTDRENANSAIINSIGDATITFSQGGVVKGTISTNQKTNATIQLDATPANVQTKDNLVTSISASSTDEQYPSAKCMYVIVGDIETLLQSV